ncbi:MAG: hypothetical protein EON58_16325 [Alphaproteobacteria bacterium]|nr:MAG: hypothetical protein EON58_16325 [Alphaproteobacteria bacterium]
MNDQPAPPQPQTKPGVASAEDGLVILDGPSGVAVTLTADAAEDTGRSLIAAAETARHQISDKRSDAIG